jgi:alcohol dehydrogenase
MTAPEYSLVKLPDNVSWEAATRWGYLGTGYAALRQADVGFHTTVLINGISGTLGLGAALFALGLGATQVLGIGRDQKRLEDVKALAPDRIEVLSTANGESVGEWARAHTQGHGADVVIDALPTAGSHDAFVAAIEGLALGGTHVNPGGVHGPVPLDVTAIMLSQQRFLGSFWLTSRQGEEMAELVRTGKVDLDVFEHVSFDLEDINEAIRVIGQGTQRGGFTNFLITV